MDKKYILVVDDTPNNLKLLGHILKDDYTLNFATDGYKAMKSISQKPPDLILLDIMMPEMDGFEVCRELKSNKDTKDIPIIFLTAKSDRKSVISGLSLGASDYLIKPFEKDDVLIRIRKNLQNSISRTTEPVSDDDNVTELHFMQNRLFCYDICTKAMKESISDKLAKITNNIELVRKVVILYLDFIKKFEELLISKKLKIDRGYRDDQTIENKLKIIQKIRMNPELQKSIKTIEKDILKLVKSVCILTDSIHYKPAVYDISPFNVNDYINNIHSVLPVKISLNNMVSNKTCINGNSFLLNQILISLVDNAKDSLGDDFLPEKVVLELKEEDKHCLLTLKDSGKNTNDSEVLFTEGYSTKQDHYGMGLTSSRYLVEEYFSGEIYLVKNTELFQIQIKIPVYK